jgi:hypothetical protein
VLCLWNVRKLRSRWLKRMTQRIPGCIAREKKKRKWSSNTKLNPQTDNWMQDFFWDSWADEVFMSQNIRTSGGRETIKINRLGQEESSVRVSTGTYAQAAGRTWLTRLAPDRSYALQGSHHSPFAAVGLR